MSNVPVYKYNRRERSKTSQYLWQQQLFKDFSAARFNPGLMFSINMLPGIRESLIEPEPQSKTSGLSYTPLPETLSWVSTQPSQKKKKKRSKTGKNMVQISLACALKVYFPLSLSLLWQTQVCVCLIYKKKRRREEEHTSEAQSEQDKETDCDWEESVSKLRQIRDLIQSNFVPEGNSAATDILRSLSLDNGPHPGTSEQTGGT